MYGASVLTYIIVSKYVDHLPFYRQRQMFSRYGYQKLLPFNFEG
ncbi:MAG: IS66 family transposase [Cryomorphaceae bacterium]|nr:IS66 family transposase [Cryomorphaceae bacterium]